MAPENVGTLNASTEAPPKPPKTGGKTVVPVITPPPGAPPAEEPEEPRKASWIKNKIARIGLAALTLGGLGGGAYVAYQHDVIPGIHQTIDIPPSFDATRLDAQFAQGGINTKLVPDNEISSLLKDNINPVTDKKKHTLTLICPVSIDINEIIKIEPLFLPENLRPEQYEMDDIVIGQRLTLPKEKGIKLLLENSEVFRAYYQQGSGSQKYLSAIYIRFRNPADDIQYILKIHSGNNDLRQLGASEELEKAVTIGNQHGVPKYDELWKQEGSKFPLKTEVGKTNVDNAVIDFEILTNSRDFTGPIRINFETIKESDGNSNLATVGD